MSRRLRAGARHITESYYAKLLAVQPLARAALRNLDHSLPVATVEPVKLCKKCGESWPATTEFFPRNMRGRLQSPCKACVDEKRRASITKPCAVPGCDQPRYTWRSAYCWEHRYGSIAYYQAKADQEQP